MSAYTPGLDTQRLYRAFTYADAEHKGQLRKDGTPYITHPLAVAEIVADLGLDVDSVIAALLHDCIEDTPTSTRTSPKSSASPWPPGGGGHQADPGAVCLQGRGADGEPAQDAHAMAQDIPGHP